MTKALKIDGKIIEGHREICYGLKVCSECNRRLLPPVEIWKFYNNARSVVHEFCAPCVIKKEREE